MISLTIDMLGWASVIGLPITGQTGHPRIQLPNQWPGKPDKAIPECTSPDRLSQNACEYALDERGYRSPNPLTSRAALRRMTRQVGDQLSNTQQHHRRLGKKV